MHQAALHRTSGYIAESAFYEGDGSLSENS